MLLLRVATADVALVLKVVVAADKPLKLTDPAHGLRKRMSHNSYS